jgi:hypothetical protein
MVGDIIGALCLAGFTAWLTMLAIIMWECYKFIGSSILNGIEGIYNYGIEFGKNLRLFK